jgi:hypothetical protein
VVVLSWLLAARYYSPHFVNGPSAGGRNGGGEGSELGMGGISWGRGRGVGCCGQSIFGGFWPEKWKSRQLEESFKLLQPASTTDS